ncbi:MAG: hypothetical protein A2Y12_14745 [Planctomycetes bacterium GWF2_42_9]|nr:MAG: hypothetical protein A2Y12_14745 [Planctomycetes bacterium GWF2_42_9]
MKKEVLFLVSMFIFAGGAYGATFNGTINNNWATAGNWNPAVVPVIGVDAALQAGAFVFSGTTAYANILRVGWSSLPQKTATLIIDGGGSLSTGHDIRVGEGAGSTGTITVNAGAVLDNRTSSSTGEFAIGYGGTGTLNVYGTVYTDSMDITNWGSPTSSTGTVNVFAGGVVVDAGRLTVGGPESWGGNGSLVIYAGGSFSAGDNWSSKLQSWIARGAIRAEPGALLVVTDHGSDAGKTFTAVMPTTAWNPYPAENEVITSTTPTLSWTGGNTGSYDIYFGTDINKLVNARCLTGDFNGDGQVNLTDLSTFAQQWLTAPDAGVLSADFDASGIVEINDFARLASNWQTIAGAEYKGNQAGKTYAIASSLTVGPTYYWRVDMIDTDNQLHIGEVWRFNCSTQHMVELFKDPYFQHGLQVYNPTPGATAPEGILKWNDGWQKPSWGFSQLGSMHDINGVEAVLLPSCSYKWENTSKYVIMGPVNSTDSDITTMIDTRQELMADLWWPAIDFGQNLSIQCPWFNDMSALWFNLDVRMLSDQHWNDPSTQGQTFFKIGGIFQDLNPTSPGYGDMLWISLGVYRNVTPSRLDTYDFTINGDVGPDGGQGKFIYQAGSTHFTASNATLQGGEWVNFHGDLKPLLQDALNKAWLNGYLVNSHSASNFKLTSFGPGWESSYRSRVELQIRNLSFRAVVP